MKEKLIKRTKKTGIIKQLYLIVLAAVIIVGVITYFTQYQLSVRSVEESLMRVAGEVSKEMNQLVRAYPASDWLLQYWYSHASELDVEYDVDYETGVKTREKTALLARHQPDFLPKYATEAEVAMLPEEDQKLYAEIVYSWLTNDINQIKRNFSIDFLFILVTDTDEGRTPYKYQFFLLSGSDPGAERGREYLQVYPLGHIVSTGGNQSQQDVMRAAVKRGSPFSYEDSGEETKDITYALAGDYADYYDYLGGNEFQAVLIGMTYNLSGIVSSIRSQTLRGTLYSGLYQFILLQLILLHVYLYGIRPMKKILQNIRLYTKTKDRKMITDNLTEILNGRGSFAVRRNEIGELSEDMIYLAAEMEDYANRIQSITAERERISAELSLASQIQLDMLPSVFPAFPEQKEFELYASMDPVREVGGDFYDFFLIDPDHLAVMIADVSGKGVPAALFMMASKIVIHNMAILYSSPAKILEISNNELCQHNRSEMFVTVWLGILELSTGKLTAANAGHEYPVLHPAGGVFEIHKDKHGFILGGLNDIQYTENEMIMEPGSRLFIYTDGVPEATSSEKELFGTERMLKALNSEPEADPKQVITNVRKAIDEFVGDAEQFDDITMLCLDYKGPAKE